MRILGIESSCDDTSAALIDISDTHIQVISEKTFSQIDIHQQYGGVIPEIAGRKHAEQIVPVIAAVMQDQKTPDAIAVTAGPGLMSGLLVGIEAAKSLAYLWNIPLIPINHIDGHIHSVLLPEQGAAPTANIQFPALCLVVSGGHTELLLMNNHGDYKKIGSTRDDAAGEAFDKIAKMMGLPYPGGPQIARLAEKGNPQAIAFPRPMRDMDTYDMSFAGLKTAVLYWLQEHGTKHHQSYTLTEPQQYDVAASAQEAIVDVLVQKTIRAVTQYQPKQVVLAGGVSANMQLRIGLETALRVPLRLCPRKYSMDNAAMIAVAAYYAQEKTTASLQHISASPNWKVYEAYQPAS